MLGRSRDVETPCSARDFSCARGDLNSDFRGYPQFAECQEMSIYLGFRESACQTVSAASTRFQPVR